MRIIELEEMGVAIDVSLVQMNQEQLQLFELADSEAREIRLQFLIN